MRLINSVVLFTAMVVCLIGALVKSVKLSTFDVTDYKVINLRITTRRFLVKKYLKSAA